VSELFWNCPGDLLSESIAVMRPHGLAGNEGLALWFGVRDGGRARITHIVDVSGAGFRTTPLYMCLSIRSMAVLTDLADKLQTVLIGQIHSHPDRFVDLSDLDKRNGIRSPDYLSMVCPYYAQRTLSGFNDCGVHVFENRAYRRMPTQEVSRRLIASRDCVTSIRCEVPA
jgi:proteasome lid subunit RPN8/RPN11